MMILNRLCCCILSILIIFCTLSVSTVAETSAETITDETNIELNIDKDDYSNYVNKYKKLPSTKDDIFVSLNDKVLNESGIEFSVNSNQSGLYSFCLEYEILDDGLTPISLGIMIDGIYPFSSAKDIEFPRFFADDTSKDNFDSLGNEYAPNQIKYSGVTSFTAIDKSGYHTDNLMFYLSKGTHNIKLLKSVGAIKIKNVTFLASKGDKKYKAPSNDSKYYKGSPIVIEGEDSKQKSSYSIVGKSIQSTQKVTPSDPYKSLINYIGGGNWKTIGERIVWETPELEAGYYNIAFSYRQNTVIGGKSYRTLLIDDKVPFEEANAVGFSYADGWIQSKYSDENDKPYCFYFSKGKHEISLSVTSGSVSSVCNYLNDAVAYMGKLYVDITKITGETVDVYRDYDLFSQISDMKTRLETIRTLLEKAGKQLLEISGEKSGSNYSVINNMIEVIDKMLENPYESHRYKSYYYTNYCSVSSVLQELKSMPLDLDKIVLCSPKEEDVFEKHSLIERAVYSFKRFFITFVNDYDSISDASNSKENITIWVSWGRDQAQVLNSLIKNSFTPKTGIGVNLKLVNASVIQATLSGKGPDCLLQRARSEPVNLAMRNVLLSLNQFSDYKDVLKRFRQGADTPYWYKNNLYALPDTQSFFVMFYRKDILKEYGLKVPKTWEEFNLVAKLLMRNNMTVYLPNTPTTDVAAASVGVGANNIFPTLLLQNNISIYTDDGSSTNMLSADTMKVFEMWTNYYHKLKFPLSLDFYNRFRTGTTPLGINTYHMYTTLSVAAPEIEGLWSFTSIPGTVDKDGNISNTSAGSGTACAILKATKNKAAAWEFLKWWTDTDTQRSYSNDLESILGPTGRVALANVEAVKQLSWDKESIDSIMDAWEDVKEIPEYPGSYYLSRSIYQAFWNVVNDNKNPKDMMMQFGKEANDEIARKWKQYDNRY